MTTRRNPEGWRWLLARYLIGAEIEVVPLLPLRPIHATETLVVKLGEEGALNTVEVKSLVHQTWELVPMNDLRQDVAPNTFIAVDVDDPGSPNGSWRYVGTFVTWLGNDSFLMVEASKNEKLEVIAASVAKAYWAPMGYRWRPGQP